MRNRYLDTLQPERVSKGRRSGKAIPMGSDEIRFIGERDSFYFATVGESGWPYVQHRGGTKGFLKVLDSGRLAFADYAGNRQLISAGHVKKSDKVSLFLMDYPARERLKIIGNARVFDPVESPELLLAVGDGATPRIERIFVVDVVGFDWNCPKWITPRFTAEEVEGVTASLKARIAELEFRLQKMPDASSGVGH